MSGERKPVLRSDDEGAAHAGSGKPGATAGRRSGRVGGIERVTTAEVQVLHQRFNDLLAERRDALKKAGIEVEALVKDFTKAVGSFEQISRGGDAAAVELADARVENILNTLRDLPEASVTDQQDVVEAAGPAVEVDEAGKEEEGVAPASEPTVASTADSSLVGVPSKSTTDLAPALVLEPTPVSVPVDAMPSSPDVVPLTDSPEVLTRQEAEENLRKSVEEMRTLLERAGAHTMESGEEVFSSEETLTGARKLKNNLTAAGESSMESEFGEYERPRMGTSAEQLRQELENAGESSLEPALSHEAVLPDLGAREKEVVPNRLAESVAYLAMRSEQLNSRAEKLGEVPKDFLHRQGLRYNKIPLRYKILGGLVLGGTAAAFSTVSLPVWAAAMGGLWLQRTAGFAGMYAKVEQHLLDTAEGKKVKGLAANSLYKKLAESSDGRRKLAAAVMAGTWTLGMGAAIGEAVHLAGESAWGETVHEWLRNHWPFGGQEGVPTHPQDAPATVQEPAAEAVAIAQAPAMPPETLVTVHASPGHGYEYMLKRLSEQLHAQHVDVSHMDPTSDAYRLATTSPHDIDTVVHQIASDPSHNFYRGPDGSVRIGLNADVSLSSNGAVEFNDGMGHMYVQAPAEAPLTPEVSHVGVGGAPSDASVQETADRIRQWHTDTPEFGTAPPDVDAAGNVHTPNYLQAQDLSQPGQLYQGALSYPLAPPFTNPHGFEVYPSETHVYAMEGGGIVADGGSYDERLKAAVAYVQQHGGSVQIESKAPAYVDGNPTRYLETVTRRGLLGFSGRIEPDVLMGKPSPESVLNESHMRFAMRFTKKLS